MSQHAEEQRTRASYLLPREVVVVFARRHWIVAFEPVATALAGLAVVVAASATAGSRLAAVDLLWWCWFALVGRAAVRLWEWRREYFVATDRRLLLIYGLIVRKVAMMPLKKVTDLSYHRSVWGRILGYGTFVLESAGQDQALRVLHHVDRPDPTYQAIISVIFRREGDAPIGAATQAFGLVPEDTTEQGALSRLQSLLPSPERKRRWGFRREQPNEPEAEIRPVPSTRPADGAWIQDEAGRPLAEGRSVYSSGDANVDATGNANGAPGPAWYDDEDD